MDRRNFLKVGAAGLGLASVGTPALAAGGAGKTVTQATPLKHDGYVREPSKKIPVICSVDVVVLGGGPAGVAAAVSAAKQGVNVLLLEREYYLGGLWTGCCVLPVHCVRGLGADGSWEKAVHGFSDDINARLDAMGMNTTHRSGAPLPDPEAAKYVLEQMLQESGARLLYNSHGAGVVMSGDRIDSVIAETKSGRVAIKTKVVIDCSGDGDILEWAGEDFEVRKEDIGAMWRYGNAEALTSASATPIKGVRLLHTGGESGQDGLDAWNLTRLQLDMRRKMWERWEKDRRQPGCEDLFLLDTGTLLGVRVTRVLNARHNVRMEDSLHYVSYDDCIGMSGSGRNGTYRLASGNIPGRKRPVWQIPYRSITPKRVKNLLVAGRCFGFDEGITYDAREIGTCFVTGQAAGNAAALAVLSRESVQDLNVGKLQEMLLSQNVRLK